jgi:transketolase
MFVIDNHSPYGGLGDCLLNALMLSDKLREVKFKKLAVEGHPACGTPQEALRHHQLDGGSLVKTILIGERRLVC